MFQAPYLEDWFCFKAEKETVYQKQKRVLAEKGPVVVGESGEFTFCANWGGMSTEEKNEFVRSTEAQNARRMRALYKAIVPSRNDEGDGESKLKE